MACAPLRRCPAGVSVFLTVVAAFMVAPDLSAQAPVQTLEGILTVVWGDPLPGGTGGEARYLLTLPDARTVSLQLAGQEGIAVGSFGRRVIVTGRAIPNQAVTSDVPSAGIFDVESITPSRLEDFFTPNAVTGTRRVIYLLAKFSDDTAVPHPPSFFTNLNNPDTPPAGEVFPSTLNGFFKKTSYNQFFWIGDAGGVGGVDAPGGWLTLPNPKSFYAPCGSSSSCANLSAITTDAMALGRAQGINFKNYDNINIVLSNDLDCCAYGGGYFSAVDNKVYGMTWEPPWGQNAVVYAHEMGHSIGLPHSGWVYYAYDSPWDVMSSPVSIRPVACGSYVSRNSGNTLTLFCGEPGDGYIATHKATLGWIPLANQVTVNPSGAATVTLDANALSLTSSIKMIKICLIGFTCTGSTARYFTVEARVRGLGSASQFDNGIPGEGIIIHDVRIDRPAISGACFFNSQSGWAVPIDSTPGDYSGAPTCSAGGRPFPNYALFNAQWTVGQTYTNSAFGLIVSVLSRSGSTFVVSVLDAAAPAITTHPTNQTIESGQTASLSVVASGGAPFAYQWYRGPTGVTTNPMGASAGGMSSTFTTPPSTTTAKYWVRVSNAAGSTDSNAATVTVTFTDNTITAGATVIKVVHLIELRSRVDALRTRFGLGPYGWTDASLVRGVTTIKAVHVTELRAALLAAYMAAAASSPGFTDPTLTAGVSVRSVHIDELRNAVHLLEGR